MSPTPICEAVVVRAGLLPPQRPHEGPSEAVLRVEFGDLLDDQEIDFDNVDETIEWALDDLKGTFIHKEVGDFNKNLATAMGEADNADRVRGRLHLRQLAWSA